MTQEQSGNEFAPAMGSHNRPDGAEAIREKLAVQLAGHIASARAAEREKLALELAEALGVRDPEAEEFAWPTLLAMVTGVRSIGDIVVGTALPALDDARRRELLVSFGVAQQWSQVALTAEMNAATFRAALGISDDGRPGG